MPGKIDKSVFSTVEVLWGSCMPVYVREILEKAVLNYEEVL